MLRSSNFPNSVFFYDITAFISLSNIDSSCGSPVYFEAMLLMFTVPAFLYFSGLLCDNLPCPQILSFQGYSN